MRPLDRLNQTVIKAYRSVGKALCFGAFTLLLVVVLNISAISPSRFAGTSIISLAQDAPSPSPSPSFPSAPPLPPEAKTLLQFQSDRYSVRVFQENGQSFLNVFDNQKQAQTLNRVPVSITPSQDSATDPTQYLATVANDQYLVTIDQKGTAELSISSGGTVIDRQPARQVTVARSSTIGSSPAAATPTAALIRTLFSNFFKLALFAIMLAMGIRWTLQDVTWLWRRPSLLLRSLFSVILAVPLLGVLAGMVHQLPSAERLGVSAMILCPGALLLPFKVTRAGGNTKYIASLQLAVCTLAVITTPLLAVGLSQFYPNPISLTPLAVAKQILVAQVLPLGIGILIRQAWPLLADQLVVPLNKIATLMVMLVVIGILTISLDKALNIGWMNFLLMVLLALATLICGHFLGGPDPETRSILAQATANRNLGLALLLVTLNFPNLDFIKGGMISSVLVYSLVVAIASAPYVAWCKRRQKN